ncbi:spheroidene monooxygenase [Marivirga sp. S37H4]|uniref:Spheroidene monooxygenase n=1 Tax=Marivirga aurantiaca TaxID=2802615 RepID=A0A934WY61_9BACT|nr:spheroidene monooxygenase [Marivirga aurantiaca]MBK6265067.1 spheroidene monooxygenase [Marivirga aurantiaca]
MVTLSIIKYTQNKWWAFKQMQLLPPQLAAVSSCTFSKVLGTGSGFGFSLWPDFTTYALLMKWKDEVSAETFFSNSEIFLELQSKSEHIENHYLESIGAHGSWYGENPFPERGEYSGGKIAVITRARINIHKLPRFWQFVPKASKSIEEAKGLVYTKGIGEWPLIEQATFSIWKNEQAMKAYAYADIHKEIIGKVKKENWYKEELFSRFNVIKSFQHSKNKTVVLQ